MTGTSAPQRRPLLTLNKPPAKPSPTSAPSAAGPHEPPSPLSGRLSAQHLRRDAAPSQPPPAAPAPAAPALSPAEREKLVQEHKAREAEEHRQAMIRRRQRTRQVLALLAERWPDLFSTYTPLAIGIHQEIKRAVGDAVSVKDLGRALSFWTGTSAYPTQLAAGQPRRQLDGTEAGEPTEHDRQVAQQILDQRAVRRQPPAG